MLAYLMEVDFELMSTRYVPDQNTRAIVGDNQDSGTKILSMNRTEWNAIRELWFELKVIK
jgi:hypothetical protein